MLVKLTRDEQVPGVPADPGQTASHQCPPPPPTGASGGPSNSGGGSGGGPPSLHCYDCPGVWVDGRYYRPHQVCVPAGWPNLGC